MLSQPVPKVRHDGTRYIVCLNEEEAQRGKEAREEMVKLLREKLSRGGVRSLMEKRSYHRFLKVAETKAELHKEKLREEADTELPAAEAALAYKGLWQVEEASRELTDHWKWSRSIIRRSRG